MPTLPERTSSWLGWAAPLAVLELCVLPSWACDPLNTQFDEVEKAVRYEAEEIQEPRDSVESLEVMTYNIKFAGGRIRFFFECPGERVHMSEEEVVDHLEGLAEKIRQVDPDVLMLQEVDVDSERVAGVDQVQWLLDHTDLNYGVYASQWRATHIPRHGLGHIDSGNAILSRWPIEQGARLALPLISAQDPVTRYFYLKRNLLKSRIDVPGIGDVWVLNTHLSAFSDDGTRRRQVERVEEELEALDRAGEPFVIGGDFNLVPPGTEKTRDFPDVDCADETFDRSDYSDKLDTLEGIYEAWQPAIGLDAYRRDNRPHLTYSADEDVFWTRKLDYLFTNRQFRNGLTHQNADRGGTRTIHRSDHAPVTAEWTGDREGT